jgi:hypothetical protein
MLGNVTVWKMTEEERLAYIEKHPIKSIKKKRKRMKEFPIDYKWRGEKGSDSRWSE